MTDSRSWGERCTLSKFTMLGRHRSKSNIQLGVKRLLRVGTCGGLQPDHALGDLIVAISAVSADSTATHLVGGSLIEAAALFTLTALRGVHGGCLLTVADIVVEGEVVRISHDDLQAAVDRMTKIALDTATSSRNGD